MCSPRAKQKDLKLLLKSAVTQDVQISAQTYLNSTTATTLHQIADVSRLNAGSNEWLYIIMTWLFQLQAQGYMTNAWQADYIIN